MKHRLLLFGVPKIPKPGKSKFLLTKVLLPIGLVAFAFFPFGSYAQTTLNATGGTGNIAGNTYAFSIGEMVLVSTVETSDLIVTQGLLQSNIGTMGLQEQHLLKEGLSAYPNPVTNILFLQPKLQGGGELSLKLYDLRGRLIMQREAVLQFGMEKQQLDLSILQEGTYLLRARLEQNGQTYEHHFKILKASIR